MKKFAKLFIAAILLLVILTILLSALQMTTRSMIKSTIENYEKALCEFRFDVAKAQCSEDGYLIRNGKKILFSDSDGFYGAVSKKKHGTYTTFTYELINVVGDKAQVIVEFKSSVDRLEPVVYTIALQRFGKAWKIVSMDDGSVVMPEDEPASEPAAEPEVPAAEQKTDTVLQKEPEGETK